MAWENFKVEQQRLSLITAYIKKEVSMTDLCKHYGVSRKTGYKWYNIYLAHGKEGLCDLPKAPNKPHHLYSKDQIETVIDLKLRKRQWGPKKIAAKLNELYPNYQWPSPTRLSGCSFLNIIRDETPFRALTSLEIGIFGG